MPQEAMLRPAAETHSSPRCDVEEARDADMRRCVHLEDMGDSDMEAVRGKCRAALERTKWIWDVGSSGGITLASRNRKVRFEVVFRSLL